ncbi:hypothetical protein [Christiangramia sabulilitoris]|uniref:DUF1579 domain-containing protein n=1 Tax=Christiangramia sabulilitoris TaxID=2583991 RepID=A0A550I6Z9_9FLAO|nr:hypothetical protein [Christiangramia sabulilitoris]TRO66731.1 hypothetical protein FGM01_02250 [Christiangramia sabulilitoris]
MKPVIFLFFFGFIALQNLQAQSFETDLETQSKIVDLYFIIGEWEGNGWRISPDGVKHSFEQTEKVQYKLDSTAILIEGKGYTDGKLIHNAMAIITSNKETGEYEFQSYLQNGMKGNFKAELKDDVFYWYPNQNVRYIISIDEEGRWYEKGEFNRQGEWMQFFEMTLSKNS